jgi:hypothetical protein
MPTTVSLTVDRQICMKCTRCSKHQCAMRGRVLAPRNGQLTFSGLLSSGPMALDQGETMLCRESSPRTTPELKRHDSSCLASTGPVAVRAVVKGSTRRQSTGEDRSGPRQYHQSLAAGITGIDITAIPTLDSRFCCVRSLFAGAGAAS